MGIEFVSILHAAPEISAAVYHTHNAPLIIMIDQRRQRERREHHGRATQALWANGKF